jgi:pimeloyl-ACP methyl ester carboxylesterase
VSNWFSGDVIANGIRVHYYRTGGDKPPLVLCHGATDNGMCWVRVTKALEADYDVIMPDARGHGLSEAPEKGYGPDEQAADLAGVIEVLKLGRPAIGGHSMGANTSLYAAASYPGLVRCAILEDPPLRSDIGQRTPEELQAWRAQMLKTAEERKAKSIEAIVADGRRDNPTWSAEEFGPWADAKKQVSLSFAGGIRIAGALSWKEALAKITCPTLLVTSDPERGGIVTPESAAEAQRILPSLNVVRLSGAGHNIRREQFDGFVSAMRGFLAESA